MYLENELEREKVIEKIEPNLTQSFPLSFPPGLICHAESLTNRKVEKIEKINYLIYLLVFISNQHNKNVPINY